MKLPILLCFYLKQIFWFLICKKKIKWLKRGTKKYYGLKNSEKKNILDPYDGNDSILFDISKCCWLLGAGGGGSPFPYIYFLKPEIMYT